MAAIDAIVFAAAAGFAFILVITIIVILGVRQEERYLTLADKNAPGAMAQLARLILGRYFRREKVRRSRATSPGQPDRRRLRSRPSVAGLAAAAPLAAWCGSSTPGVNCLVSAGATRLSCVSEQSAGFPWPQASATGIGSMPGTDVGQTCRMVFGELPDLPYLPELPGRGPGADMTGRAAALLVSMPVEITTRGWKLAVTPGRETSLAAGYWSQDLDTLEEVADGFTGAAQGSGVRTDHARRHAGADPQRSTRRSPTRAPSPT